MLNFSTIWRREMIADIPITTQNAEYNLPTQGGQIPNDRFLHSLVLTYEGRWTNPAAPNNPTAQFADAPFSIIDRVSVEGYHRPRGKQEKFFDLRGPDIRELVRIYRGLAPQTTIASGGLSLADGATNDVRFVLPIPFVPLGLPVNQQANWLLDAPNYNALKLTVKMADVLSAMSGGTMAHTYTSFGAATGTPRIRVEGIYAQGGPSMFAGFLPGRVWRWYQEVTGSIMTTTTSDARIINLPKGHFIRGILLKNGVKSATVTAGNNAYLTLSDTILANIDIFRGINKINRQFFSFVPIKDDAEHGYGIQPSTGFALVDWAINNVDREVLDTRGMTAGPTGDIDLYIEADVTGVAAQGFVACYEEWRDRPSFPVRAQ